MLKDTPYSDWRIILLKGFIMLIKPLASVAWIFNGALLSISPNVPTEIKKSLGAPLKTKSFLGSFLITFFFCFFVTATLCYLEGTLTGSESYRRYFLEDGWNIVLYSFVCPVYVSLALGIIKLTISHWSELADFADDKTNPNEL